MIDALAGSLDAIARHQYARLPLVAAAGVVTSFGPCVAPRYVALAALLERPGNRAATVAAFVTGVVTAYVTLGAAAGLLGRIWSNAAAVYATLAVVLGVSGLYTVLRRPQHCHTAPETPRSTVPLGGALVLGAGSAFVISPCCTPIVAGIAALNAFERDPLASAAFLAAFALGHAAPLLALGTLGSAVARVTHAWSATAAPAVVSGTLMIALGLYYGLLA